MDLFFGLAYLARRPTQQYPAADLAAAGLPLAGAPAPPLPAPAAAELLVELHRARRLMLLCQGLKHHRAEHQQRHWRLTLGLGEAVTARAHAHECCAATAVRRRTATNCNKHNWWLNERGNALTATSPPCCKQCMHAFHAQAVMPCWHTAQALACCARRT